MKGGVYIYRVRKPSAILGWPIIGRHFGYVGETVSFWHRDRQHKESQPWSDLNPKCYRIPLPGWKPLLLTVETLVILLVWPVYNHKKNLWNPRRIPLSAARRQREARDSGGFRLVLLRVFRMLRACVTLCAIVLIGKFLWMVFHA